MDSAFIHVKGAREHNLRNVSLTLPRGELICFTGVSGSGKSSFAFDTLFAEGQRRYLESLSSYARQFLGQLAKPDVDQITGLSPAISIQQKSTGWNPRSTVGTITQIHDYLRVLFARVGRQHCPQCDRTIAAQTREQIIARILDLPKDSRILILAPVIRGQKGEHRELFEDLLRKGFARARVNGEVYSLNEPPTLARHKKHHIEVVVDRILLTPAIRPRLAEAVETALKVGDGALIVGRVIDPTAGSAMADEKSHGATEPRSHEERRARTKARGQSAIDNRQSTISSGATGGLSATADILLSSHYACTHCNLSFEPPHPQLFSFNSPAGMCLRCDGLGTLFDYDPDLLVPDPKKSFFQLAVEPMRSRIGRWRRHIFRGVAAHVGFDIDAPWHKLPAKARHALLYGTGDAHITYEWRWSRGVWRHGGKFEGVVADLREKHRKATSPMVRAYYEKYMRQAVCPDCKGGRLSAQALAVKVGEKNINDVCALPINGAAAFFDAINLSPTESIIAADVVREIRLRLQFLCDVGLEYLTLDRTAPTLSGGESQRIRLASQIGAGLVGVLYILDEPSIGLHHRDNEKLLQSLCRLRDLGNTVIVVEHDEQTMRIADEIVDFGPGPGVRGGEVVAHGDISAITASPRSITGAFLRGDDEIAIPKNRRPVVVGTAPWNSAAPARKRPKSAVPRP